LVQVEFADVIVLDTSDVTQDAAGDSVEQHLEQAEVRPDTASAMAQLALMPYEIAGSPPIAELVCQKKKGSMQPSQQEPLRLFCTFASRFKPCCCSSSCRVSSGTDCPKL
jgi:hypothetical protein